MKKVILYIHDINAREPYWQQAKAMGYDVAFLRHRVKKKHERNFDYTIETPLDDIDALIKKVKNFHDEHPIAGIISATESRQFQVATLQKELDLPGPSVDAIRAARNKYLMREEFAKKNVPQPKYLLVDSIDDAKAAASEIGYPVIMKPLTGAKSLLVKKISKESDFDEIWETAKRVIDENPKGLFDDLEKSEDGPSSKTSFLIEECLEGKQVTTTSFIAKGQITHIALADLLTAKDLGLDGFGLITRTTPSQFDSTTQKDIMDVSTQAIEALGVDDTIVHPEIMVTEDGPKVIEVGARIGGYRPEMTKFAFGVDMYKIAVEIATGQIPAFEKSISKAATACEVFPGVTGTVKTIDGIEEVEGNPHIHNLWVRKKPGKHVSNQDGERTFGIVFFTVADKPADAERIALESMKKIHYVVEES